MNDNTFQDKRTSEAEEMDAAQLPDELNDIIEEIMKNEIIYKNIEPILKDIDNPCAKDIIAYAAYTDGYCLGLVSPSALERALGYFSLLPSGLYWRLVAGCVWGFLTGYQLDYTRGLADLYKGMETEPAYYILALMLWDVPERDHLIIKTLQNSDNMLNVIKHIRFFETFMRFILELIEIKSLTKYLIENILECKDKKFINFLKRNAREKIIKDILNKFIAEAERRGVDYEKWKDIKNTLNDEDQSRYRLSKSEGISYEVYIKHDPRLGWEFTLLSRPLSEIEENLNLYSISLYLHLALIKCVSSINRFNYYVHKKGLVEDRSIFPLSIKNYMNYSFFNFMYRKKISASM